MEGILAVLTKVPFLGTIVGSIADRWILRGKEAGASVASARMPGGAVRSVVADLEPGDYVTVYLVPRRGRDRYVAFRVTEESECVVRGGAVRARRVRDFEGAEISSHAIPVREIERIVVHHEPGSDPNSFHLAVG